ncbi:MAG TPA: universal stress protein [Candidatus Melainabacteria bacterium]|jgi:nucleotide-binding universal stress UspA family protein|nr:universal stress protein [Candidatus Melainabacteria bacterium]HIN63160.1 universal stress protein [Candidatus Obscuribacterales bacterium]
MKVLIAIEESECSKLALESVLERHWPEDSQFRVINVFEPFPIYGAEIYSPRAADSIVEAERELLQSKKKIVKDDIELLRKTFAPGSVSGDVLTGDVRNCILEEAKEWGADLIVLGSHGRKGFSKLFLGSVAEGVAGHADCSVEIVKHKKTH